MLVVEIANQGGVVKLFVSSTLHCAGYSSNSTSHGQGCMVAYPFTNFKEDGLVEEFVFEAQWPRINDEWIVLTKPNVEY